MVDSEKRPKAKIFVDFFNNFISKKMPKKYNQLALDFEPIMGGNTDRESTMTASEEEENSQVIFFYAKSNGPFGPNFMLNVSISLINSR